MLPTMYRTRSGEEKVVVMTSYSNTHLVELALRLIRTTDVDAVLAGAVETLAESCVLFAPTPT